MLLNDICCHCVVSGDGVCVRSDQFNSSVIRGVTVSPARGYHGVLCLCSDYDYKVYILLLCNIAIKSIQYK